MMKQKNNKGLSLSKSIAEITEKKVSSKNLRLAAIIMAANALCFASCDDSAGVDEEVTEYKTTQTVLRFTTAPDGKQIVTEEQVQADLPDPVMRQVEKDQHGQRWIKIYNDPVPFADQPHDTTGLRREYAYINLEKNQLMSQERFEADHIKLQQTSDTVYWHPASPYAFDGFWSTKAAVNKDEAMEIHASNINAFAAENVHDTAHIGGASGDWSVDTTQTKPVQTHNGGSGHYIFARSYYPYAYHDHGSLSASTGSAFSGRGGTGQSNAHANRFATVNLFRQKAVSMTSRMAGPKTFQFSRSVRMPTVRGGFGSRGFSFSA